ncbi:MAG: hypothetical protein EYR95_16135 [Phormidium sp. SL48-SHIP]|nr:MAG: hypothetical protein EYR95_16135 [Phormidium sp. SL48-SHIP]
MTKRKYTLYLDNHLADHFSGLRFSSIVSGALILIRVMRLESAMMILINHWEAMGKPKPESCDITKLDVSEWKNGYLGLKRKPPEESHKARATVIAHILESDITQEQQEQIAEYLATCYD